jgi:hypothetical protein
MGENLSELELLQTQIKDEEEQLGKYCRRCHYEGKKVFMHTASVQWTDKEHVKHFTPILRVCPRCRDIRWFPNQYEKARRWGGYIHDPQTWEEDRQKYHTEGFSKLELADLMQELALIRARLTIIKKAFYNTRPEQVKGWVSPPLNWEKFIKSYFEKI